MMRSIILLFILVFTAHNSFAQKIDSVGYGTGWISTTKADSRRVDSVDYTVNVDGKVLTYRYDASRGAAYPNNYTALNADFKHEFKYPTQLTEKLPGTVRISFIVERDSTLTDFEIKKSFDPLIDNEVIRALKSLKKWIPAKQGGYLVRHRILLSFWIPARE